MRYALKSLYLMLGLGMLMVMACASSYRLPRSELPRPTPWPYARGDLSATGAVVEGTFDGHLDVQWERRQSGKPAGPLTLYGGTLVYPSTKRRVEFVESFTGRYLGRHKSGGAAQTGVVISDSLAFYALSPYKNKLCCINLHSGKTVWERDITDASRGSIIAESRLFVGSVTGSLLALDLKDGSTMWSFSSDEQFVAPAAFHDGTVYIGGDGGTLYALEAATGEELFRTETAGPIVSAAAVAEHIIVAQVTGHVAAIDPKSGEVRWEQDLDSPLWTAPAATDDLVFVGLSQGDVVALELATGRLRWRFETTEVVRASPIVVGEFVIVGTMGGTVFSLDAADGRQVDRRELRGAVAQGAVTDGSRVIVATESGMLFSLGGNSDQH